VRDLFVNRDAIDAWLALCGVPALGAVTLLAETVLTA
jgi:hypothetical protein